MVVVWKIGSCVNELFVMGVCVNGWMDGGVKRVLGGFLSPRPRFSFVIEDFWAVQCSTGGYGHSWTPLNNNNEKFAELTSFSADTHTRRSVSALLCSSRCRRASGDDVEAWIQRGGEFLMDPHPARVLMHRASLCSWTVWNNWTAFFVRFASNGLRWIFWSTIFLLLPNINSLQLVYSLPLYNIAVLHIC